MASPAPKVLVTRPAEGVVVISINRAKVVNCVDGETALLLERAFVDFEEDPSAKVAILRGEGGNFCSGADLAAVLAVSTGATGSTPNPMSTNMDDAGPMGPTRLSLSKPVIACITGYCLAGGIELAAWCSLRVVGAGSQIGVKCRYRGVPLIDGGTVRLPQLLGHSIAADLILTGRTLTSSESLSVGFANRLVPVSPGSEKASPESVLAASVELAVLMASHPQTCMRNDWRNAREVLYISENGDARDGKERSGQGRYNVRGGERIAMAREFDCGLKSLDSGEHLKQLEQFLGKSKL